MTQDPEIEGVTKQLKLDFPDAVLVKATEIYRRIAARSLSGQLKSVSQIIPVLCLDLACSLKECSFPRAECMAQYRVPHKEYVEKREFLIEKLDLPVTSPTIAQLCVKFGCTQIREFAEHLQNEFLSATGATDLQSIEMGALDLAVFLICYNQAGLKPKKSDNEYITVSQKLLAKYDRLVKEICSAEIAAISSRLKMAMGSQSSHQTKQGVSSAKTTSAADERLQSASSMNSLTQMPNERRENTVLSILPHEPRRAIVAETKVVRPNNKHIASGGVNLMIYRDNLYSSQNYKDFLNWKTEMCTL